MPSSRLSWANKRQDFGLSDGVQSAGGLIGNEERRPVKDGHGDDDTLGLAHAQLGRPAAQEIVIVREADICQGGREWPRHILLAFRWRERARLR